MVTNITTDTAMKITAIHPSYKRPALAFDTANKWLSSATTNLQYIISVDSADAHLLEYEHYCNLLKEKHTNSVIELNINNTNTSVMAINNAALKATGDLFIVVSDDFDCFSGWDEWLLSKVEGQSDFVVKTKDTLQEWLITLPIMDRKYYERFGYIYYPEYHHMFSDTEMTEVAHLLGRVIDLRDDKYVFLHKHPCGGFTAKDETYNRNDNTWNQGEELFNERKKNNFYVK